MGKTADPYSYLDPDFLILAHRGAGAGGPENTLESWESTWSASPCLIPECDVSTTLDGVAVGFHDEDVMRVGRDVEPALAVKKLAEMTWQQASRIDVGAYLGPHFAGQTIPRLSDAFEKMRGRPERRLFVDYKNVSLPMLAEMVRPYGIDRQIIFAAPEQDLLIQWKELVPDSKTMQWIWNDGLESVIEGLEASRQRKFAGADGIQLHVRYLADGGFLPSLAFVGALRNELKPQKKALQVFPSHREYGGRCPLDAIRQLLDLGVTSFASDYPEDVLEVIGKRV